MKLKKILLTFICVIAPFSAWAAGSAFINPAIILKEAPQAIAASKAMENEFKGRETALRALLTDVRAKEESYNKNNAIMSEEKRKLAEEEILTKKREFRFEQQSLKEDLQVRRKQMVQDLQKVISGVIQAYGKKKGYDFIFTEGVAYADESVDITQDVLKELKSK